MKSNHIEYWHFIKESSVPARIGLIIALYVSTHLGLSFNQLPEMITLAITAMFAMHIITWMLFTAFLGPEK